MVLILLDDWRWDAAGTFDHPFAHTPNIDRLAEEGVTFENAFVVLSLCSPSRATVLTGLYPRVHGVTDNSTPLRAPHPTVAHLLGDAGYVTAFIGKWHMGNETGLPEGGFDRWVSFPGQGAYEDPFIVEQFLPRWRTGHMTDILTEHAVEFVRRDRERRFFMVLSHKAVHVPNTPQPRLRGLFANATPTRPMSFGKPLDDKPSYLRTRRIPADTALLFPIIRSYHETLTGADESVGAVVAALEERHLLDSTLIIVTSDNGYLHGEHNLLDKRVAYEASIRIPFIVRYPRWFSGGTTQSALTLNLDIAPTVLEAAGVRGGERMHGRSLRGLASDPTSRSFFLYEYYRDHQWPTYPTMRAVRSQSYKLITYPDGAFGDELYYLTDDPHEMWNAVADPAHADSLATLRCVLDLLERTPSPAPNAAASCP